MDLQLDPKLVLEELQRRSENLPKDEAAPAVPSSFTTKSRLAAAIASGLRSFAIHVLVTGHVPRCHAATCRMMLGDLNSWFFHGGQRWGRRHQVLLRVWACLQCVVSIIWLMRSQNNRWASMIGQCLAPAFRDMFWQRSSILAAGGMAFMRAVANAFYALQTHASSAFPVSDASAVYAWIGHGGVYIGLAHLHRTTSPADPGIAIRWHEHENLRVKRALPDACRLRYVLARRAPQGSRSFLVMRTGDFNQMASIERIFIKMLSPNMNYRIKHGTRGQESWQPSSRRRPPQSARRGGEARGNIVQRGAPRSVFPPHGPPGLPTWPQPSPALRANPQPPPTPHHPPARCTPLARHAESVPEALP